MFNTFLDICVKHFEYTYIKYLILFIFTLISNMYSFYFLQIILKGSRLCASRSPTLESIAFDGSLINPTFFYARIYRA